MSERTEPKLVAASALPNVLPALPSVAAILGLGRERGCDMVAGCVLICWTPHHANAELNRCAV